MHRSTEQVFNAIVWIIASKGVEKNGNQWARITNKYLAKKIKCTEHTISNQTKKIVELGLLQKAQFDLEKLDRTNSWAINFENPKLFEVLAEHTKQKTFFSSSTVKRITKIYKDININHNKSQEFLEEKNEEILIEKKREIAKKVETFNKNEYKNVNEGVQVIENTRNSPILHNYNYLKSSPPGNTTVQDMIKLWNETFNRNDFLNKNRARFLYASFLQKFKSLDSWKKYLERIKKMDLSKIRDLFSWALSFKTINGLLNFTRQKEPEKLCIEEAEAKKIAQDHLKQSTEQVECLTLRKTLLDKYGAYTYNSWFSRVIFKKTKEKVEILGDSFVVDYIQTNFLREYS